MPGRRLAILILCALTSVAALAAEPAAQGERKRGGEPLSIRPIRGNLFQVGGGAGANAFFYVTGEEVLVIDAKMTEESMRAMLAEIKKISDKPVRRLILTHSDGDHVGGLTALPPGVTIIAQAKAAEEIKQANATAPNKLPVPGKTFEKEMAIQSGAAQLKLLYFGPAHTSGDAVVYFPAEKAAIVGDLVFIGRDPLIHKQKGGTSEGVVAAQKALLALDANLYLSGHADPIDRKTLAAQTAGIQDKQAKVKLMVKQGKTLEEIKKAMGVPESSGGRRWPSLVEIIYQEATAAK